MRVKLLKDYDDHKKGEIIDVKKDEAFWIIETGHGIYTKDMTPKDYRSKMYG